MTFLYGNGSLLHDITHNLRHVCALHRKLVGSIVHTVQCRDILQQGRQSLGLSMRALDKLSLCLAVHLRIIEDGLGIA